VRPLKKALQTRGFLVLRARRTSSGTFYLRDRARPPDRQRCETSISSCRGR
jgi:hypothetical protein